MGIKKSEEITSESRSGFIGWLRVVYLHKGRFRSALLEDLVLLSSLVIALPRLFTRSPMDGFFDSLLTMATLSIVAVVMLIYHVLWRALEGFKANQSLLDQESLYEQIPRFLASLALLVGLYNFTSNIPIFLSALVLFYFCLLGWHKIVSKEMRETRGTFTFDCFGLACATAFAAIAFTLYMKSRAFWGELPRFASDGLSADVWRRSFAGKQTNLVYAMGLFAGAMCANAILAFIRGLSKNRT